MKRSLIAMVVLAAAALALAQSSAQLKVRSSKLAAQAQQKLEYVQQNGAKGKPDPRPTTFTEDELNAWLNDKNYAKLPAGVQWVQLAAPGGGRIEGSARVDFDEITAGRRSANPLLALFTGVHDVEATAHGEGSGGQASLHIESVSLDNVTIPRMALQFFVDRYIKPKHPEAGLDSTWKLPSKIDTVQVQTHKLILTQK